MLLTPWGRVSCARMAASFAMVIYAHMTHLNEPLHWGSPLRFIRDWNQCHGVTFNGVSQNEYRISTSLCKCLRVGAIPFEYSGDGAYWLLTNWHLQIVSCHVCAECSNVDALWPSFLYCIKDGAHLNSWHFLLVTRSGSFAEASEHISPGKGAFPRLHLLQIKRLFCSSFNVVSLVSTHY